MASTVEGLIHDYRTDPISPFLELRYEVRLRHDRMLARIARERGKCRLRDIRARTLVSWHMQWKEGDKNAMATALMSRLRVLFRFGATMLENSECERLASIIGCVRLQTSPARNLIMTPEQATAIRTMARAYGYNSIALVQALQFDLGLGQKDIIGEWIPLDEPDPSTLVYHGMKWRRGLLFSAIDENLVLRHCVGSAQRPVQFDLKSARMVLEEINAMPKFLTARRDNPMILCEHNMMPFVSHVFRAKWRMVADAAGIPANMRGSDGPIVGLR